MRPMFNSEKAKMSPLNKKNKNLNERYKGSKNEVVGCYVRFWPTKLKNGQFTAFPNLEILDASYCMRDGLAGQHFLLRTGASIDHACYMRHQFIKEIQLNPDTTDPPATEIHICHKLFLGPLKSFFIYYIDNNKNLPITDKNGWSLEIR